MRSHQTKIHRRSCSKNGEHQECESEEEITYKNNWLYKFIILYIPNDQRSSNAISTNMTWDIRYIKMKAAFTPQNIMNKTMFEMSPPILRKAANPTAVPTAQYMSDITRKLYIELTTKTYQ